MHHGTAQGPRDEVREALHVQMLGRNIFVITMIGSVAFLAACFSVLVQ